MPSTAAESLNTEAKRDELNLVLGSQLFSRSPGLAHLLSYLCEKSFAGESDQIKEYSVAVDVFGRRESFDQDSDSIVRVQANRLRKRLAEYYDHEGAVHPIHITIPVGQYVPVFEERSSMEAPQIRASETKPPTSDVTGKRLEGPRKIRVWLWPVMFAIMFVVTALTFVGWQRSRMRSAISTSSAGQAAPEPAIGLPVGDELRILCGVTRTYVDRSGKVWNADKYFNGGTPVRSPVRHIWRTLDSAIYRTSRQGDFTYDIPLKRGIYELHLHFAEAFYGPEETGGGGEGSRVMNVTANGTPLLTNFDVLADSGGARTADVKVFADIVPADDGFLHLGFSSAAGGKAMVSGIELVVGVRGQMRPVRIVARDVPYYSNDSHWWSSDVYFKGGQLAASEDSASGTDDPELYETERWGHFSYAIPVTPGKYIVILHFIERSVHAANQGESIQSASAGGRSESRMFNVYCNGTAIIRNLNILNEAGENRPLLRKISGLEPNAQNKMLLEFEPVIHYATVTAIEVLPQ